MGKALDVGWESLVSLVGKDMPANQSPAMEDEKPSDCWLAGVCVCRAGDRQLWSMHNKFLQLLKKYCPRGSKMIKSLTAGDIVVHVKGVPEFNPLRGRRAGQPAAQFAPRYFPQSSRFLCTPLSNIR